MISIIVPVYNSEKYIGRCVESLTSQTYKNIEIILVNDGSADNSGALCDQFAKNDGRIKVVHKQNGGVSAARNDGIQVSAGEYLMFCDSDDRYLPQMVEKLLESIIKNGSDIALCGFQKETGGVVSDVPMKNKSYTSDIAHDLVMPMCVWGYAPNGGRAPSVYGSVWRGIYKRALVLSNGIKFATDLRLGEDMIFNMEAFLSSRAVSAVEDCLYFYYEIPTSATHIKGELMWSRYALLWERAHGILQKNGVCDGDLRWHNYQLSRYAVSAIIEGVCPRDISKKEKKQEVKSILSHPKLKKTLRSLPSGLSKKDRLLCRILRPAFSGMVLWYYQHRM